MPGMVARFAGSHLVTLAHYKSITAYGIDSCLIWQQICWCNVHCLMLELVSKCLHRQISLL